MYRQRMYLTGKGTYFFSWLAKRVTGDDLSNSEVKFSVLIVQVLNVVKNYTLQKTVSAGE